MLCSNLAARKGWERTIVRYVRKIPCYVSVSIFVPCEMCHGETQYFENYGFGVCDK